MTRIVANMVVRNEGDSYLKQVLARLATQVDDIIVTDDCSDDNTAEMAESFGAKVQILDKPTFQENEGELRQRSWNWLESNLAEPDDTLVLAIDADEELYETVHTIRSLVELRQFNIFNVIFFHMWDNMHYRVDGGWRPHGSTRLFRYVPGGSFLQRKIACFLPDTQVRTKNGFNSISEIRVGDEVLTEDGSFQKVLEVIERDYSGDVYGFRSKVNPVPIYATPEHPFLALEGRHSRSNRVLNYCVPWKCERGNGLNYKGGRFKNQIISHTLEWKSVRELKSKDWSVLTFPAEDQFIEIDWINIPSEYSNERIRFNMSKLGILPGFKVDGEFLWMIGMYLSEGSSGSNSIRFTLSETETYFIDRLTKYFKSNGYHVGFSRKSPDSDGCEVIIHNTALAKWFPSWLGKGSGNKEIPKELINLRNTKLQFLLDGILDGDGTKSDELSLDTIGREKHFKGSLRQTSYKLSLQVIEILLKLGGLPSSSIEDVPNKKRVYQIYTTTYPYEQKRGFWTIENQLLTQVLQNEKVEYTGKVYNLRVATNNTYVVGSTVVHNCGSEPTYVQEWMRRREFLPDTGLVMKHLSYIKDEDKQKKYERYCELDGGNFHAGAHIQSIIDPLEKVQLEPWRWG